MMTYEKRGTYEKIESEGVVESLDATLLFESCNDLKATRSQNDGERQPKSAI